MGMIYPAALLPGCGDHASYRSPTLFSYIGSVATDTNSIDILYNRYIIQTIYQVDRLVIQPTWDSKADVVQPTGHSTDMPQ